MKLTGYAIAGAIALVAGAELLSSVVAVVFAFRFGDPSPLIGVVFITVGLLLVVNRVSPESPLRLVLNILTYAASGYLAVVVFVIALPYGLTISGIAAGLVAGICSFIKKPDVLTGYIRVAITQIKSSGSSNELSSRLISLGDGESLTMDLSQHPVLLEHGTKDKVIQLMRDRPLLPISFTHYVGCDILFICDDKNPEKYQQILNLLEERSIGVKKITSHLFTEAIHMIPIIDSQNGLGMDEYRLARDEKTINDLLSIMPVRMTIFPTTNGLNILVPDTDAPGLLVETIEQGKAVDALVNRNYSLFEEVEKPV